MKKTLFTLALLAALMFCSCNNALGPNEEPLIRAGGIIDRIYLTSEDHPEKNAHCTIALEDNKLVLTFDKKQSFTAILLENDTEAIAFCQKYTDVTSFTIDLTAIPNGTYHLFLNNTNIFTFFVQDGKGFVQDNSMHSNEEQSFWADSDNMFVEVNYTFEVPELDFSYARYPLTEEDWEGWPFGDVERVTTSVAYKGAVVQDGIQWNDKDSVLRNWMSFTLGTEFIIRTTTHGSFDPEYAPESTKENDGEKPRLAGEMLSYKGKPLDDLRTSYTRGVMLPSVFKKFTHQTDSTGKSIYVANLPIAIRPATAPYLIEIIDQTGEVADIDNISIIGFAPKYDLSVCEPVKDTNEICVMKMDEVLPMRHFVREDGSSVGIIAAKLRTWGQANDYIEIVFHAHFINGEDNTISCDITRQVASQPLGGIIDINWPGFINNR